MTKREFLAAVVEMGNADLAEFATAELEKMDAVNAKRREKASEKSAEKVEEIKAFVAEFLGTEAQTASDLVAKMTEANYERADGKALNVQFVSAMARKAVELGLAAVTEVKVSGKGTQKAYTRA